MVEDLIEERTAVSRNEIVGCNLCCAASFERIKNEFVDSPKKSFDQIKSKIIDDC